VAISFSNPDLWIKDKYNVFPQHGIVKADSKHGAILHQKVIKKIIRGGMCLAVQHTPLHNILYIFNIYIFLEDFSEIRNVN